jgi:ZIP family zinc transporter
VSLSLLIAIFVSNLPEAIGSATDMHAPKRKIIRLWIAVAVVCTAATVAGYAIADNVSDAFRGAIDGFAAGALLVMLIDSMIPEARRKGGAVAGLVTVLGFAVAAALS